MSLPAPGPGDAGWGQPAASSSAAGDRARTGSAGVNADPAGETASRGLPGGRVVTVATLVVVGTAVVEAASQDRIGLWTDVALVIVSAVAALVTRTGDRSLPAMMPPLAFLAATLVAGQLLIDGTAGSWRTREALMLMDVLGANAPWVVAATALSVTIALVRHLIDRHRARRA